MHSDLKHSDSSKHDIADLQLQALYINEMANSHSIDTQHAHNAIINGNGSVTSSGPGTPTPSSPRNRRKKYRPDTELVYIDNPESGIRDPYNASSVPIYQTATFKQTSLSEMGEYDYTRSGNPTRSHLEHHLAKIMDASRAYVVSSGMGAMDVITRLVKSGEEIIAGNDLYGGTNRLLTYLASHQNIKTHHVDTSDPKSVIPFLDPIKTRMVLLESPTNPLIKIADIRAISDLVHTSCPEALVVVDNTMMSPLLCKPLALGADIVYDSGTKYLSGHHDLMAGAIGVKDKAIAEKIYFVINSTGCGLAPFDCWLLLRGVKTLAVRMERQQQNAMVVARFLESHGFRVRYPGLESHPQYELHHKLASGPGAVLSFETGDVALSEKIVEGTKLWGISVSFGCVNSLISMPCLMSHASIDPAIRAARQLPEDLIRLCVGIENVEDLVEDLETALFEAGAIPQPSNIADGLESLTLEER